MNGRPWSVDDSATVRRMAGSGASDAEIARHMGRDVKMVGKKRRDMGVERGVSVALAVMMCRINTRRASNKMTTRRRGDIPKVAQERDNGRC